jgi:hypothetical protein
VSKPGASLMAMNCDDCGVEMASEVAGGILWLRCPACGKEVAGPYDPAVPCGDPSARAEWVSVLTRWPSTEPIPAGHLLMLRKRLPALGDVPIPSLKDGLVGRGYPLGRMWREYAEELRRDLEGFGLEVTWEVVAEP